jgi:acyl carrier protein
MTSTVQTLKQILAKIKSDPGLVARLPDDADLVDQVGLDSLETLQFMLEVEAVLAVQIDFDKLDFSYLRSLQALAGFLDTMPARAPARGGA